MATINDIVVNIIDGVVNLTQAGFGIPAIFGETQQYKVLKIGTGKSQLVFVSASRGGDANVEIISGSAIAWSESGGTITLEIPSGTTAKEVKDDFDANAPGAVTALVSLQLANSGTGDVSTATSAALAYATEFTLASSADVADLLPYYLTTDPEYVMSSLLFNQKLSPEAAYVFNAYEASPPSIATKIITFTNQDFYFLLLTDTTKARAIEANTYAENNDKVVAVASSDTTLVDDLAVATNIFVVFATDPSTHPEAAIVGLQAPKTPGSTNWRWQIVNGISAEESDTLINAAISGNGNVFASQSGLTYFLDGSMTNGLFIDQKRSRDYIKARISEAFLALFVAEDKIPYDDTGINTLKGTLSDRLNAFGDQGIIAAAVSATEVEQSFNNTYQYTITAPTRAQVIANDPNDVVNRSYSMTFDYVESGAINDLTVTGKVVLELGGT